MPPATLHSPRDWMQETCLPLWADKGYDRTHEGFVERFDLKTGLADAPFKRVRVQARQIYVFSHAHILGWSNNADLALRALSFVEPAWSANTGWARTLTVTGELADPTPDLYDNAFMLFALGWAFRATGEKRLADRARETLLAVKATLGRSDKRGYLPEKPVVGHWVQNPHMHMLEACLVLAEATGESIYFEESERILAVFRAFFYDDFSETLAEYFNQDWDRASGDSGRITEPGHQFEWRWLLAEYARIVGSTQPSETRGLFRFANQFGVDPTTGLVSAEIRDDGLPLNTNLRVWPQTELLKARLSELEAGDATQAPLVRQVIDNLFDIFLDKPKAGLWIDLVDTQRRPLVTNVPASTLYHVCLAFSEAERLGSLWKTAA